MKVIAAQNNLLSMIVFDVAGLLNACLDDGKRQKSETVDNLFQAFNHRQIELGSLKIIERRRNMQFDTSTIVLRFLLKSSILASQISLRISLLQTRQLAEKKKFHRTRAIHFAIIYIRWDRASFSTFVVSVLIEKRFSSHKQRECAWISLRES